jgi:hypothetical protein
LEYSIISIVLQIVLYNSQKFSENLEKTENIASIIQIILYSSFGPVDKNFDAMNLKLRIPPIIIY